QIAGAHLMEHDAVAVDEKLVLTTGYARRDVRVDDVGHAKVGGQAIEPGQIAADLPFFLGDVQGIAHRFSFMAWRIYRRVQARAWSQRSATHPAIRCSL